MSNDHLTTELLNIEQSRTGLDPVRLPDDLFRELSSEIQDDIVNSYQATRSLITLCSHHSDQRAYSSLTIAAARAAHRFQAHAQGTTSDDSDTLKALKAASTTAVGQICNEAYSGSGVTHTQEEAETAIEIAEQAKLYFESITSPEVCRLLGLEPLYPKSPKSTPVPLDLGSDEVLTDSIFQATTETTESVLREKETSWDAFLRQCQQQADLQSSQRSQRILDLYHWLDTQGTGERQNAQAALKNLHSLKDHVEDASRAVRKTLAQHSRAGQISFQTKARSAAIVTDSVEEVILCVKFSAAHVSEPATTPCLPSNLSVRVMSYMSQESSTTPEVVQTALNPYSHAWDQLVQYSETRGDDLSREFRSAWLGYKATMNDTPDHAEESFVRLNMAARALSLSYFEASWLEVRASLKALGKISMISPPSTTDVVSQARRPSETDEEEESSHIYTKEERKAFEDFIMSLATDTSSPEFGELVDRMYVVFERGYTASLYRPDAYKELTWIGKKTTEFALMRDRKMALELAQNPEQSRLEVTKTALAETFIANLVAAVPNRD